MQRGEHSDQDKIDEAYELLLQTVQIPEDISRRIQAEDPRLREKLERGVRLVLKSFSVSEREGNEAFQEAVYVIEEIARPLPEQVHEMIRRHPHAIWKTLERAVRESLGQVAPEDATEDRIVDAARSAIGRKVQEINRSLGKN